MENEVKIGCLSPENLKLLKSCVERSPNLQRDAKDYTAGYYVDPNAAMLDKLWNEHFRLFDLGIRKL